MRSGHAPGFRHHQHQARSWVAHDSQTAPGRLRRVQAGLIGLTRTSRSSGPVARASASTLSRRASSGRDDRSVPARLPGSQQARIPAGRKGDPDRLAATVVYLASDASAYVTSQTLAVDEG